MRSLNPRAEVLRCDSPVTLDDPAAVVGRRVVVVEDGPTLTHGSMSFGAGVGAREAGAAEIVDPAPYAEQATLEQAAAGLIGHAHWPPTAGAVRWLLDGVWPAVRAQEPGAVLRLAGRGMEPGAFAASPGGGVEWLPDVPSAGDFLRSLGVLLYPVRRGSGTKVKVLEALALGIPVVTTPEGAETRTRCVEEDSIEPRFQTGIPAVRGEDGHRKVPGGLPHEVGGECGVGGQARVIHERHASAAAYCGRTEPSRLPTEEPR